MNEREIALVVYAIGAGVRLGGDSGGHKDIAEGFVC